MKRAWSDIDTAPYHREVEVRVNGRPIRAMLCRDASMNEREEYCDQWQATTDDFPECWSDGACWESNANEMMSAQPTAWRPLP